ncbi:MAG: hypothetical protein WKF75_04375 [Singulisphaera sp.]
MTGPATDGSGWAGSPWVREPRWSASAGSDPAGPGPPRWTASGWRETWDFIVRCRRARRRVRPVARPAVRRRVGHQVQRPGGGDLRRRPGPDDGPGAAQPGGPSRSSAVTSGPTAGSSTSQASTTPMLARTTRPRASSPCGHWATPESTPLRSSSGCWPRTPTEAPWYTTSFFPLLYAALGKPFPEEPPEAGPAHGGEPGRGRLPGRPRRRRLPHGPFYRLIGKPTPKADRMVARVLRDQKPDGGWDIKEPDWDVHAGFDAVFILRQLGGDAAKVRGAIARGAGWALRCRNEDGGFGHFPGRRSDMDAVYFQLGTLIMAGRVPGVRLDLPDSHTLGWGHAMQPGRDDRNAPRTAPERTAAWAIPTNASGTSRSGPCARRPPSAGPSGMAWPRSPGQGGLPW